MENPRKEESEQERFYRMQNAKMQAEGKAAGEANNIFKWFLIGLVVLFCAITFGLPILFAILR